MTKSLDQLNTEVTSAIVAGEEALREAIVRWNNVGVAESAIFNHPETPGSQRRLAGHGVSFANKVVRSLRSMLEGREP